MSMYPSAGAIMADRSVSLATVVAQYEPDLGSKVGFLYAFRICLTYLWFQHEPAAGTAVSIALSVLLLLIALFYDLVRPPDVEPARRWPRPLKYIACYLGLAFISLLWTTTQSTAVAGGYWAAMFADVMTVILLLRGRNGEDGLVSLLKGFVAGSATVAVVAWFAPVMEDLRLGNEDFLHPNAIGFEFGIATLCAIYVSREGRLWKWLGAGLAITLLRTFSKASIVAFVAAAGFYLLRDSTIRRRTKLLLTGGATLVLVPFLRLIDAYLEQYSQGSQLETLTGRTLIWAESLDIALDKPWMGHGFYSYRWVVPPFGNFEAWQAHDELLQQFFAYGVVGVFLTVVIYYSFFRQVRNCRRSPLCGLAKSLLIFTLMRGLVDTDIFGLSFPLWLMAAFVIALDRISAGNSLQEQRSYSLKAVPQALAQAERTFRDP